MGAYQYMVGDSILQVTLSDGVRDEKLIMEMKRDGSSSIGGADVEEKRIRISKSQSFSVSKIWLWFKKSRSFPTTSNGHADVINIS
ncbi:hypothetical protein PTKIN_Ptkin04bG0084600 [Pterospermum kingtungense]